MKNEVRVVAGSNKLFEVVARLWGMLSVELDSKSSDTGLKDALGHRSLWQLLAVPKSSK